MNYRYHALDFWRGVACLGVVVAHSCDYVAVRPPGQEPDAASLALVQSLRYGGGGVTLFFVISGYCITAACDAIRRRPKPASQFFLRRFRRIFPPYWIALLFYLVLMIGLSAAGMSWIIYDGLAGEVPGPSSLSLWQWVGTLSLTEVWRHHLVGEGKQMFLGQAWSLCYEEQFYAVCGLAVFLSAKRFFWQMAVLTTMVGLFVAYELLLRHVPAIKGFFFDGMWLQFAAGVWVYYRLGYLPARFRLPADLALLALTVLATVIQIRFKAHFGLETVLSWAFALLLSALHRWDIPMARSKLLRPVYFVGIMCYSLYLIHGPFTRFASHLLYCAGVRGLWPSVLVAIPACVLLSVGLAWLFHVGVERRFLNTPAVMPHLLIDAAQKKSVGLTDAKRQRVCL